ncbi:hypothetical protein [Bradyrhizobium ivorense]|uniref:hypothetical protein n=1 Tax=Bradyrhizobium ivorense TaxID=2511166 RepID=UPI0010B7092B|nr:hypothetical protein [Bradyrhizobium ivorense]VIO80085.1 hypothetical protein CI41S_70450 [Bradyrhizobium ivorense]
MDFEIPQGADREYLIVFGVAAIYVATIPRGEPCIVGVTRDLGQTFDAIRDNWAWSEIACAFWVKDRETAEVIVAEATEVLPRDPEGRLAVRAEFARRQIEAVAERSKVPLTNHDAAMSRVHAAVRHVQEKINEANASGDLAWFNSAYRSWRIEAKKFGRVMSYAEALARLRRAVTKRLITLDVINLDADLLPGIFPDLPNETAENYVDGSKKPVLSSRTRPRPKPRADGSGGRGISH